MNPVTQTANEEAFLKEMNDLLGRYPTIKINVIPNYSLMVKEEEKTPVVPRTTTPDEKAEAITVEPVDE